jgi:hypothetical protein
MVCVALYVVVLFAFVVIEIIKKVFKLKERLAMMTREEHKAKLREILKFVEGIFTKYNEARPIVLVVKDGGMDIHMVTELNNVEQKDALSEYMAKLAREGAEAIVFVSESWSLRSKDAESYKGYPSIADNPNRIEIVSVLYSTKDGDMMASAEINREYDPWADEFKVSDCKPVLKPWDIYDSEEMQTDGRFCRFWDKSMTQEAEQWASS